MCVYVICLYKGRNTPDNLLDAPIGAPIASAPAPVEKKLPPARPSKPPARPPPPKKTGAQAIPTSGTKQTMSGSSSSSDLLTGSPPPSADSLLMVITDTCVWISWSKTTISYYICILTSMIWIISKSTDNSRKNISNKS